MAATRTPRERWVEAGLQALAEGGPNAVRVEALAKQLGVTKGGFYGFFADREALLTAILDTWERESTDDVLERVEREGGDPRTRITRAGLLTFSSHRLLPIDLAVRDWARHDESVAERLRRVDNRRMDLLRATIGTFCPDPAEAEARSLLAFCLAIGEHFLAADQIGYTRGQVLARAADLLFSGPGADPRLRLDQGRRSGQLTMLGRYTRGGWRAWTVSSQRSATCGRAWMRSTPGSWGSSPSGCA